ncbi:dockerin type I domain-containing protein [Pseudoalteromonas rubra]|uniref:dockerin type I domain-containing protein n=1 Tax=Pseudoalteromonas rubra TaxID=43658 RepID=UPI000F7B0DE1|nr:dockerin type I domain-containing protein [Pseudoalteromonas rubra]
MNTRKKNTLHTRSNIFSQFFSRSLLAVSVLGIPYAAQAQQPDKVGERVTVNSHLPDAQGHQTMELLQDGSYVVAWESHKQGNSRSGIYAQRYSQNGTPLGSEFIVNAPTHIRPLERPAISRLTDGGFVIIWLRKDSADYTYALIGQRFDANGTKHGEEFQVPGQVSGAYGFLSISDLPDGGFIVTWHQQTDAPETRSDIIAQRYTANGELNGARIEVNTSKRGDAFSPVVITLDNGQYVIAWQAPDSAGNYDIVAQRYNTDGTKSGSEHTLHPGDGIHQAEVSLSALPDGGYIATWQAQSDNSWGIFARRFASDGSSSSSIFQVNTGVATRHLDPEISALANGGYVITWMNYEENGSLGSYYAQAFSPDNQKLGGEFLIEGPFWEAIAPPSVLGLSNDSFVVSWAHVENDSSSYDVFAQRYKLASVQSNTMTLTLPQTAILQGDVVTLPLKVSGTDIYGLDAVVSVSDTSKARISGGEYGEFLPSDERLSVPMGISDNQWDGALALMAPATAKSGEGEFAAVTLIAEQAGTVNLTLQAQMTDSQGNYLLQNSTDYTFTIAESVTLTGNIANLGTSGDFTDVTFYINGQLVTINPDGSFSAVVGLGEVTMALSAPGYLTAEKQVNLAEGQADIDFGQINLVGGDSNGDNQIDIADLTLLLGAYRSVEGEQNGYVTAADFNRDGAINLQDLTLLGANFGKQGPQSW